MTAITVDRQLPVSTATSASEAWSHLESGDEGRLHHSGGTGPRRAVLSYAPDATGIWLRIPDFAAAAHATIGHRVTFEVDGHGDDGSDWVAQVAGTAIDGTRDHPDDLLGVPAHVACRWVLIPATEVEGSRRP